MSPDQFDSLHLSVLRKAKAGSIICMGKSGAKAAELCRHGYLTARRLERELGGLTYSITKEGEAALAHMGG